MNELLVRTAPFVLAATTFAILGALVLYMMIGEINRRLPDHQQISYLLMYPGKLGKIRQEYKRFYPTGRLDLLRIVCNVLMFLALLGAAWRLGFFE